MASAKSNPVWFWGLVGLLLFTVAVQLWGLDAGSRSEYYSAFPVGMSKSLGNFWFGAMDPAGSITLDKIPGSYWIPAIFVALFGFSTLTVLLPNALASIALAAVVAFTGRRLAGDFGGLVAGLIVATTPIVAAVGRSNQPETMFLLALAIAAHWGVRAIQDSSRKNLIYSGVWIGLAFQCYMIEAWALWPALIVAYLLTNSAPLKKLADLAVAGVTSLAVSLIWVISVDLTPASNRPYIGGSNTNSAFEMVFGYNAMGRFGGTSSDYRSFTPPFSGGPSLLRLVNSTLVAQIGWLIPVTIVAIFLLIFRKRVKRDSAILVFIGGFFLTFAAMFSVVAGLHQFYTAALAIPIALILAVALVRFSGDPLALGLIVGVTLLTAAYIGVQTPNYLLWVVVIQVLVAITGFIALLIGVAKRARLTALSTLALGLLLTPLAWSADTHSFPSSINPIAGPVGMGGPGQGGMNQPGGRSTGGVGSQVGPGGLGMGGGVSEAQVTYLKQNSVGAKYSLAVFGAQTAAQYITGYQLSVLPIGGFSGQDPAPTLAQFKKLVAAGDLRFVLIGGMGGFGAGQNGAGSGVGAEISNWVSKNCKLADYSANDGNLYDCVR